MDYLGDRLEELDGLLARVEAGETIDTELDEYRAVVQEGVAALGQFRPQSTLFNIPPRLEELRTLGGFEQYAQAKRHAA